MSSALELLLALRACMPQAAAAMRAAHNRGCSLGQLSLGTLVAFLVGAAALLSVSPALHEQLHAGTTAPHHLCAVTLFASGNCEAAGEAPLVATPAVVSSSAVVFVPPVCFFATKRVSSILEHAPPFSA